MAKRPLHDGASKPSLHERLLTEALGRLAAPEVVERIVRLALHEAGLGEVPEDPAAFGSFACGALRSVVEEALGEDCAAAVVTDVEPAFLGAPDKPDSNVRRRGRRSVEAPSVRAPVLVVATKVRAIADTVAGQLRDRVKLVFADDVFGVLQSTQRYGGSNMVLLLDDDLPSIGRKTLATIARLLPPSASVVHFGRTQTPAPDVSDDASPTWMALGPIVDPDAITDVCLVMLPEASARPRVLLVHPDADYRAQQADVLRAAGYDVGEASDGVRALEMCESDPPDAVLAAASLSGLAGTQLAAILEGRSDDGPVFVLLSSNAPLELSEGVTTVVSEDGELVEVLRALVAFDA